MRYTSRRKPYDGRSCFGKNGKGKQNYKDRKCKK